MADHIQLHQGWMKYFKNDVQDNTQVYCYNLNTYVISDGKNEIQPLNIGSIKTKSLGAIDNFYTKEFELFLGKNWETKFGEFVSNLLLNLRHEKNALTLNSNDLEFFQKFMALSVGRSRFYKWFSSLNDKSKLSFIKFNELEPLSVTFSNLKLFENMQISFLKNNTNRGFVLPSYSYYCANSSLGQIEVIPLTPKEAIFFTEKKYENIFKGVITEIVKEDWIKELNRYALICEYYTNRDFIIAQSKNDLNF